jgi:hypothetical protein
MAVSADDQPCPDPGCGGSGRRVISKVNFTAFPGSYSYDRMHGYFPGTSSNDVVPATEDF